MERRAEERTGRRDLRDGVVVHEHQRAVDVDRLVEFIVTHRAHRVALVGTLQVVERGEVELVRGRERTESAGRGINRTTSAAEHARTAVKAGEPATADVAVLNAGRRRRTGADEAAVAGGLRAASREVARVFRDRVQVTEAAIHRDVALTVGAVHADDRVQVDRVAVEDAVRRFGDRTGRVAAQTFGDDAARERVGVVMLIAGPLAVELDALEVLAHDEVHDAGDGVRAVHGRGAAGQDFDVVDERGGDLVQVGDRERRVATASGACRRSAPGCGSLPRSRRLTVAGTGRAVRSRLSRSRRRPTEGCSEGFRRWSYLRT